MIVFYVIFLLVLRTSSHILPDSPTAPTSDDELYAAPETLSNEAYPDERIDNEQTDSLSSDRDELPEPPSDDEQLDSLSIIMEDSLLCSWYVLYDETGTQINLHNFTEIIDEINDLPKTFKSYEASLDTALRQLQFPVHNWLPGSHMATEQEKKNFLAEAISPYLDAEDDELHEMDAKDLVQLANIIMFNSKSMALPPCFIPANTSEQHRSFAEKTVSEAYSMSDSEALFLQRINQQALLVLAEEASQTLNNSCHAKKAFNCENCKQCRNECAHTCDVCEDKVMTAFLSHVSRQKRHHHHDDHHDDNHHHHDDHHHHHHHHDNHHHGTGFNVGWSPLGGFGVGWTPPPLWSSSTNNGHDLHIDLMPTPYGIQPVIHKDNLVIPLTSNHGYNHGGGYNNQWNTGYNSGWNQGSRSGWNQGANTGWNQRSNPGWNHRSNPGWNSGYNQRWNSNSNGYYGRKRRSVEQENYLKVYMQKYFQNLAKEDENMFKSSKRTIVECSDCVKCNIGCRDPCIKCQDWRCHQDQETP